MSKFAHLIDQYKDYLTLYHECRIPKNPFFDLDANASNERLMVVSSPSRMGNHLLMSMLDGHPELPSVPGEDGFLLFSFMMANYDVRELISCFKHGDVAANMMNLASNGGGSKWQQFSQLNAENIKEQKYSGVGSGSTSAVVDFEGVVFDINAADYASFLKSELAKLQKDSVFNDFLVTYTRALGKLNPKPNNTSYDSYLVHGAMRTQLLWLCETMPSTKIMMSVRAFPSYLQSHVKSRYGDVEYTDELVKEAWEHWFHKVIDAVYLRLHYPDQVGLVTFEDLIGDQDTCQKAMCGFLEIQHAESMNVATIYGNSVKGNSWKSRNGKQSGGFYKPAAIEYDVELPKQANEIWSLVQLAKLK